MHSLLLWLLLSAPALRRAQALATAPAVATQQCTLLASDTSCGTRRFRLDVGRQAQKYLSAAGASEARADQTALNEIFTVADALNLLSSHGWECIGVSSIASSLTAFRYHRRRAARAAPWPWARPRYNICYAAGGSEVAFGVER